MANWLANQFIVETLSKNPAFQRYGAHAARCNARVPIIVPPTSFALRTSQTIEKTIDKQALKDAVSDPAALKRAAAQAGEATGITRQVSAASKFASALQDVVAQDLGVAAKRRK